VMIQPRVNKSSQAHPLEVIRSKQGGPTPKFLYSLASLDAFFNPLYYVAPCH